MALFKEAGVLTVEIGGVQDGSWCESCQNFSSKIYGVQEVPDIPYELCTSDRGCRCIAIAETFVWDLPEKQAQ
jgi:hypothetical protein